MQGAATLFAGARVPTENGNLEVYTYIVRIAARRIVDRGLKYTASGSRSPVFVAEEVTQALGDKPCLIIGPLGNESGWFWSLKETNTSISLNASVREMHPEHRPWLESYT